MIQYSIETLYHFKCSFCKQWWTIGDYNKQHTGEDWIYCPNCGHMGQPRIIAEATSNE